LGLIVPQRVADAFVAHGEFAACLARVEEYRAADVDLAVPRVRVRALVTAAADRRGDAPDRDGAVWIARPVMLRRPSVAGAHVSLVAALSPVG
jgi:hypothetical protein